MLSISVFCFVEAGPCYGTHCVNQASLKLLAFIYLHLPDAKTADVCLHVWLDLFCYILVGCVGFPAWVGIKSSRLSYYYVDLREDSRNLVSLYCLMAVQSWLLQNDLQRIDLKMHKAEVLICWLVFRLLIQFFSSHAFYFVFRLALMTMLIWWSFW